MKKVKVWILDDERDSALGKLAPFFPYTDAALGALDSAEALEKLNLTRQATGVWLRRISPRELFEMPPEELRHGIALLDVNWQAGSRQIPGFQELSDQEVESYGITLARWIVAHRPPEAHFHVLIYSQVNYQAVADYFTECHDRAIPDVRQIVLQDKSLHDPRVGQEGWKAYLDICGDLLRATPAASAEAILAQAAASQQLPPDTPWRTAHLLGRECDTEVAGYALADLAWPFLNRLAGAAARWSSGADPDRDRLALSQVWGEWADLFDYRRLPLTLPLRPKNLSVAFLLNLLRYGRLDHLDALLYFRLTGESRFFLAAEELARRLDRGMRRVQDLTLRHAFDRIPRIQLGTNLDKVRAHPRHEGRPEGWPSALLELELFDVQRNKGNPHAHLGVEKDPAGGFRLRVSPRLFLDCPSYQIQRLLAADPPPSPETCLAWLPRDPDHLGLLLGLAGHRLRGELELSPALPAHAELVQKWKEWTGLLTNAIAELEEYARLCASPATKALGTDKKALLRDLDPAADRLQTWTAWLSTLRAVVATSADDAPSADEVFLKEVLAILSAPDYLTQKAIYQRAFAEMAETAVHAATRTLYRKAEAFGSNSGLARNKAAETLAEQLSQESPEPRENTLRLALLTALHDFTKPQLCALGSALRERVQARFNTTLATTLATEAFLPLQHSRLSDHDLDPTPGTCSPRRRRA